MTDQIPADKVREIASRFRDQLEPHIPAAEYEVWERATEAVEALLPPPPRRDAAQALADAGLLAPEPRIIRTREELAALDRMTVLMHADDGDPLTLGWHWFDNDGSLSDESAEDLPTVVVATGDQVRAARQALKGAADVVD